MKSGSDPSPESIDSLLDVVVETAPKYRYETPKTLTEENPE
jgi:hypothetical protein